MPMMAMGSARVRSHFLQPSTHLPELQESPLHNREVPAFGVGHLRELSLLTRLKFIEQQSLGLRLGKLLDCRDGWRVRRVGLRRCT